jgi:hypothetical protein
MRLIFNTLDEVSHAKNRRRNETLCATAVRSQAVSCEILYLRGNSYRPMPKLQTLDGQQGFFLCLLFERTFER